MKIIIFTLLLSRTISYLSDNIVKLIFLGRKYDKKNISYYKS